MLKMKEMMARTKVLKARTKEVTITPREMGTGGKLVGERNEGGEAYACSLVVCRDRNCHCRTGYCSYRKHQ